MGAIHHVNPSFSAVTGSYPEQVRLSKTAIVTDAFHGFSPYGVSGVVVIAESHVTIHTWPEQSYAAVDIFTCGEIVQAQVIQSEIHSATGG